MRKAKIIFYNLLTLTATSLFLRTVGMTFQVFLANKVGPAGIGLLQLIMSVYFFAATFATSGFRLAATRLVAEEESKKGGRAKKAVSICLGYSLLFSIGSAVALYCLAPLFGNTLLGDGRTIMPLRIYAVSLPFLAMNAVLGGYFTAIRRAYILSLSLIAEQCIRVSSTVFCFHILQVINVEYACGAIAIGAGLGELFCFLLLLLLFCRDHNKNPSAKNSAKLAPRALKIAFPVALSAYITSAIRAIQQTLIPRGLTQSGASRKGALETYGIIQGMTLPLLLFPGFLLNAATDLVVPELAECQMKEHPNRLGHIVNKVIFLGLLFSSVSMTIFFRYADSLGQGVYNSSLVGHFLKILAPLAPIFYMDLLIDAILKGIGQQMSSLLYNIFESSCGILLIALLLPRYGIGGYVLVLILTRALNLALSVNRLRKFVPLKVPLSLVGKMFFSLVNGLVIANILLQQWGINWLPLNILVTGAVSYLLLRLTGCITIADLAWFSSLAR